MFVLYSLCVFKLDFVTSVIKSKCRRALTVRVNVIRQDWLVLIEKCNQYAVHNLYVHIQTFICILRAKTTKIFYLKYTTKLLQVLVDVIGNGNSFG